MNGKLIKLKIVDKEEKIKDLAKQIGVHETTISNWIHNRNTENIEKFLILCSQLQINPLDLLDEDEHS